MTTTDGAWPEMVLRPVGVVRSDLHSPTPTEEEDRLTPEERIQKIRERHRKLKTLISELVIDPDLAELLDGIEDFSHILVLFWPHLIPPERRSLRRVHPMRRKDLPLCGIFATRSPARPNPVLISRVRLLERKGNVLRVEGLDAVDGSPIVDIKPHIPPTDDDGPVRIPTWLETIRRDLRDDDPETHSTRGRS